MTFLREQALRLATAAAMVTALAGNAYADELSFHFELSNGTQSASADFTFSDAGGGPVALNIVLTNTMTTNAGPNWLTGLFFNLAGPAGSPTLNYVRLSADGHMITLEGTTQSDFFYDEDENEPGLPGNFWAFRQDSDLPGELPFGDQQYGLGAAGLDVFGLADMLDQPPDSILPQPAGSDGGILADILGLEVPPGHEGRPFVLGSLGFDFLLPGVYDLDDLSVSDIAFIFGTGFEEVVLIPLPLPVAMAGAGLIIVVCFRRRLVALGR
ncbi:MAG: XDD4 family exosortase-dependent surface protein [Phycisphaerales bacterium]